MFKFFLPPIELPTPLTMPEILLGDMVAFYAMDTSAGAAVPDSRGNASDLVDNNSVQRTTGKNGNAAMFDVANNRYLNISAANDTEHALLDFTISFWLYVNAPPSGGTVYQYLYGHGSTAGGFGTVIRYAAIGTPIDFIVYKGSDSTFSTVHASCRGAGAGWTFLCAYHNSAAKTFGIYSDSTGSLLDSNGSPGTYAWVPSTPPYSNGVNVGLKQGATAGMLYMDNLVIFNRALDLEEITWLWNSGSGRVYGDFG